MDVRAVGRATTPRTHTHIPKRAEALHADVWIHARGCEAPRSLCAPASRRVESASSNGILLARSYMYTRAAPIAQAIPCGGMCLARAHAPSRLQHAGGMDLDVATTQQEPETQPMTPYAAALRSSVPSAEAQSQSTTGLLYLPERPSSGCGDFVLGLATTCGFLRAASNEISSLMIMSSVRRLSRRNLL